MATVTLKGSTVCNLTGTEINVGDTAPEVVVVATEPMLSEKKVGGAQGKKQVLVVVPSLDTPVCDAETRKFNEQLAGTGADVAVISMDLPFAGAKFCSTAGIKNLTVCSDFRNKDFASAYGVLLADGPLMGLTCRAIFVVDADGKVCYKQIVPEITAEPNYDEVIAAAK